MEEIKIKKVNIKDKIEKYMAYNGRIAITLIASKNLVEEARKIHDLSPVATACLGRLLTMAEIMGSDLKADSDVLTLQIKGNGPIGNLIAVVNNKDKVKGMVQNPYVDLPLNEFGKLDVGGAVGNEGYINVIEDIGLKNPYIGVVPIFSGEIAEDFARYFSESEQTRSAVALGVLVNKDGVKAAGGYMVTAMPDATDDDISNLEKNIYEAGAISKMLDEGLSLYELAQKISGDKNIRKIDVNLSPKYECDCNKEKVSEVLVSLGKKELEKILKEDKQAEIVCHFCNKKYHFDDVELKQLIEKVNIKTQRGQK